MSTWPKIVIKLAEISIVYCELVSKLLSKHRCVRIPKKFEVSKIKKNISKHSYCENVYFYEVFSDKILFIQHKSTVGTNKTLVYVYIFDNALSNTTCLTGLRASKITILTLKTKKVAPIMVEEEELKALHNSLFTLNLIQLHYLWSKC